MTAERARTGADRGRENRADGGRGRERCDLRGCGCAPAPWSTHIHPAFREPRPSQEDGGFFRRDQDFWNDSSSPQDGFIAPESRISTPIPSASSISSTRAEPSTSYPAEQPRQVTRPADAEFSEEEIDLIDSEYYRLFPPGVRLGSSYVPGPNLTDSVVYKRLIYSLSMRVELWREYLGFCERSGEVMENAREGARRGGWTRGGDGGDGGSVGNARTPEERERGARNWDERARQTSWPSSGTVPSIPCGGSFHRDGVGRSISFDSTFSEESDPSDQRGHVAHHFCRDIGEESTHGRDPLSDTVPDASAASTRVRESQADSYERNEGERTGRRGAVSGIRLLNHVRRRILPGWDES